MRTATKVFWTLLLLAPLHTVLKAQSDLMLYNFTSIGQSLHVNPTAKQQSKFYLSLPAVSGYSLHYHNNSFSLYDVLQPGTDINDNLASLSPSLDARSQFTINQQLELFGLGFKAGRSFFSFGATQNIDFNMNIPPELFNLLFASQGNSLSNFSLNSFDLEISNRTSYYFGYQLSLLDERLRIGGRFKYLVAQQHAYFERMDLSIRNESNYSLRAQTDVLLRTTGVSNSIGLFDDFSSIDPAALAITDNRGTAFDLGIDYSLSERWSISGSLLDWGSIVYREDTRDYSSQGDFEFNGFEADLSSDDPGEGFENLLDSIAESFNFQEQDGNQYTRALSPRVFAALNYELVKGHSLGLIYHARIWSSEWYHDYGINYQGRILRGLQLTGGYSIINGAQHNIGAGIQLKLGPMQLYVLSENLIGGLQYTEAYTSSLRLGLNIAFFGKRDRKKKEDETKVKDPPKESNS